jgi:hypothetical protein
MDFRTDVGASAHDAMHRLPGMPDHARAGELNARQHRPLRNRPLRNHPLRNRYGRQDRPARLFAGWQAWLGQRLRQGQR